MKGFLTLEKKYGITVEPDWCYYDEITGKKHQLYKMYSADGCTWNKGMTREEVKKDCEEWAKFLLSIKHHQENKAHNVI